MGGDKSGTPVSMIGGDEPAIDFNGTPYTSIEGSAADNNISIRRVNPGFDPVRENGIALTTTQAQVLGVKVGDRVIVRDRWNDNDVEAVYYDNAGRKGNLRHVEMSPGLADALRLSYRNKKGNVVDAIARSETMKGRFEIRKIGAGQ